MNAIEVLILAMMIFLTIGVVHTLSSLAYMYKAQGVYYLSKAGYKVDDDDED